MIILAIDPGPTDTAWVEYNTDTRKPVAFGKAPNASVLEYMRLAAVRPTGPDKAAIEMIASYGMAVGKSVFETCVFIGRLVETWERTGRRPRLVYRMEEKIHLCRSPKANDGNIRQAIMDRYGSTKAVAIGTKKNPGPLYGVTGDVWAALAVAITAAETEEKK